MTPKEIFFRCPHCIDEATIQLNDLTENQVINCSHCGANTLHLWCPTCEDTGQFAVDGSIQPIGWKCFVCRSTFTIDKSLYEKKPLITVKKTNSEKKTDTLLVSIWNKLVS